MSSTLTQWNTSADWYDHNMGSEGDHLNKHIIESPLLEMVGNISGKAVLDIGCGSGYFTQVLAKKAKEITGTDFAPDFIALCQKKFPNIRFVVQDITGPLRFDSNAFDIVVAKMVLQYVKDFSLFASETARVLKPGGKVIIAVDHPLYSQFYWAQSLAGKPNEKFLGLEHYFSHLPQSKLSLWGKVKLTWYPRTFSDYLRPFIRAGLRFDDIEELGEQNGKIIVPRVLLLSFIKQ